MASSNFCAGGKSWLQYFIAAKKLTRDSKGASYSKSIILQIFSFVAQKSDTGAINDKMHLEKFAC